MQWPPVQHFQQPPQLPPPPVQYVVDTEQTHEASLQLKRNVREIGVPGTAVAGGLTYAWLQRHHANALAQVRSTVAETPGHPSFQTVYGRQDCQGVDLFLHPQLSRGCWRHGSHHRVGEGVPPGGVRAQ